MKFSPTGLLVAFGMAAGVMFAGSATLASDATKIAFLMPCTECADRWETKDRPFFIEAVNALDRGRVDGVVTEPRPSQSRTCGNYRIRFLT